MENRWSDEQAQKLQGLDLLLYASRLIGQEESLVIWGGGNTGMKLDETDFRGRQTRVLRIKGSGSDLKTIEARQFPGVRLDDVLPLLEREEMSDEEMVEYLAHTLMEPQAARPSIETLLHAFLPYPHIYHTHADAILSLTNLESGRSVVREALGKEMVFIPYVQPGFRLAKLVAGEVGKSPGAPGAVLEKHGLFTWGESAKEAYNRTIEIVSRAEQYIEQGLKKRSPLTVLPALENKSGWRREHVAALAPVLRGAMSRRQRMILLHDDRPEILEFVNSEEAGALSPIGPATPDHVLRTKGKPLFVPLTSPRSVEALKESIPRLLEEYAQNYLAFVERNRMPEVSAHDPYPRVLLIPGIGLLATGKSLLEACMARDIYVHTISVIKGAASLGKYSSITEKEIYDMEYWPLELYKLTLAPPEAPLSRRIAFVTGAASGIGRAIAHRLAAAGAHLVVTDIDEAGVQSLAEEIIRKHGWGRAVAVPMDVTDETSVNKGFRKAVLTYGGIDLIISNAGLAHVDPIDSLSLEDWNRSLAVNATGHFLVAREALKILKVQNLGGSFVFVSSKNVFSPGKDFAAYSAAKAAETQLAKVLALEAAELGIRVNLVNPDAIFEGSKLWNPEVRERRAKAHGIKPEELEEFYRQRNLLRTRVTAEDVAEAVCFLASDASAKTTGCTIPVDGGVKDAFPR